jgi:hypothetical protein
MLKYLQLVELSRCEETMQRMLCAASLAALMGGALFAPQAIAETKKLVVAETIKKASPPKARITVQRRSFLDGGTEVRPGERKFMDYAFPPGHSPTGAIDYTSANPSGPHGGILNPYGFSGRPPFGW